MPITSRCSLCGKLIDRDNAYVIIRKESCTPKKYPRKSGLATKEPIK